MYRVEWIRHQEREKKKLEDEKEKERGWFYLVTDPYSICTCNITKYWHIHWLQPHWLCFGSISILILKAQFCCLGIFVAYMYVASVLSTALIVLEKLQFGTQALWWGPQLSSHIPLSCPFFLLILPSHPFLPGNFDPTHFSEIFLS